jgi:DNA-directed RNA polymerase II subunit RPB2
MEAEEEAPRLTQHEAAYLLDCFAAYRGLVAHQIVSFNRFLLVKLQEIVLENSELRHQVERGGAVVAFARCSFQRVWLRSPSIRESDGTFRELTPNECRVRGLSYLVSVYVDILQTQQLLGGEPVQKLFAEVLLCRLPCMIGCAACQTVCGAPPRSAGGECPLDQRGYFVVNGNEKVVISQEKMRTNFVFVKATAGPSAYTAEVRSLHASKTRSTSTLTVHLSAKAGQLGEILVLNFPFIEMQVSACALLRILGFPDLEAMLAFLRLHLPEGAGKAKTMEILTRALNLPHVLERSRRELVDEIGRCGTKEATAERRARYIEHILANEFLPHEGLDDSPAVVRRKCVFFALILSKLARVFAGSLPPDDRDDFSLKRVETTGQLFALLTRQLYRQLLKMMGAHLAKCVDLNKPLTVTDAVNAKKITSGVKYAVSTGVWGVMKQSSQNGVAQILARMNYAATVSHLRRVNTPINREGKLPKPRELPLSHYMLLCPVETPEGQACGLVESLSLLTHVRLGADGLPLVELLRHRGLLRPLEEAEPGCWKFLLNGGVEGVCADGPALAETLRAWRRASLLPCDASVWVDADQRAAAVDLDGGCLLRPMLRVAALEEARAVLRSSPPSQLWEDLLASGALELIDKNEERHVEPGRSHVDVHEACMLGVCAGAIAFLDMNQAPRNIYEAAMTKQSIGSFTLRPDDRLDTVAHALHYPQLPLVQTMVHGVLQTADMAGGTNVMVAALAFTGFNQEDSIIFNQGAIDRGLFRSSIFKCFKDEEKGVGADVERFGKIAASVVGARKANYCKVEGDGLPPLGALVENGDVIIGKRMAASQLGSDRKKKTIVVDHSTILKSSEPMRVRRVFLSSNKDGGRLARVCLDAVRVPEIGDKFSSHHGQKGVVGMILPEADMPFAADGLVPDIIVSPHGLPSRMTVGQLLECLLGKLCCLRAETGDGTPFSGVAVADVGEGLRRHGFHDRGEETLFHGVTGEPLKTTVFFGPVHFQKLRHMVGCKVHARSRGPRALLTHSPLEGRSREGGLRVGEMERDCILAHGASGMLLDRLFEQADAFDFYVCRHCGLVAEAVAPEHAAPVHARIFCRGCRLGGEENVAFVRMPYAMKLLHQELAAMSIAMRFKVQPRGGGERAAAAA